MYVLFGLAIAATVIAAVFQFGAALKDNPANAIKSLLGLVLLAVVLIVAWAMGDGTPMQIPGYSGTCLLYTSVRSVDPYLDKEALRVINTMPKWKPGMQRGKPVRVKFTVPVMFRLQ